MMRFKLPFAIFLVLAILLAMGLSRDPKVLPSALIDKPAPAIDLPLLDDPQQMLKVDSLRGKVWLLNVWASWCAPCRDELPVLTALAREDGVALYGLNYKDKSDVARTWLRRHGNPYLGSAVDSDGRVGIDYGVYGVPETFVIDRAGRIRFKHAGPITPEIWRTTMLPVVRSLQ
ncbi:DsbE family thiol:disulfide interchange protein [Variovorax rhizosphaerae]|uniref:DsbE family thiol:disulfide interchange protein n=1 Tax=Variovorax rhizosphaerae TaxID=1836200 RepID=A0ABU8WGY8_9BURK